VPFLRAEISNGYRTDAQLIGPAVRNLRTIGTMFVLEVRNECRTESVGSGSTR
jgi:hypothetical protein